MFDTKPFEDKMNQALSFFEEELKKIRTGRAHPSMLESVTVVAYGQPMPLNQVGNIVAIEPQLLQVTPFDPSNVPAIAAAIRDNQSLGLNPSDNGRVVRVPIPPLNTERRQQMVKQLGEKVEECRIALRNLRHDALKDAKVKKDAKELSEDSFKGVEKAMDEAMKRFQADIDQTSRAKEQEIMTV
jgi:ribosome recycling factor